ncbi:DUF4190 domain-containing protein [Microbispora sp. ATCC PTA-5024]|uniref:DUF4190 domain-containing protein n=1 Tax=Microbispora sp. ATCC PTA-5024 TaxID=316330 RepID=UPI0003DDEB32|nr:DUF4190 domain-containing protein [Microbispora sp. ATCC PTA-5024]ETK36122.1 membrane protein [Microbispora sp. ATCC PTA-5024]
MSDPYGPPQGRPYGTPQQYPPQGVYPQHPQYSSAHQQPGMYGPPPKPRNGAGVTALVLGVIACLFLPLGVFFVIGFLIGVPALIFGIVGLVRVKNGTATNRGVSIAGTALAAVAMAGAVVLVVIATAKTNALNDCVNRATTAEQQIACSLQG